MNSRGCGHIERARRSAHRMQSKSRTQWSLFRPSVLLHMVRAVVARARVQNGTSAFGTGCIGTLRAAVSCW
eukprot:2823366-Prymnesium_polylepis.1